MGMEVELFIIIVFVFAVAKAFLSGTSTDVLADISSVIGWIVSLKENSLFYVIISIPSIIFIFYLNFRFHKKLFEKIAEKKEEKKYIEDITWKSEEILKNNLDYTDPKELSEFIEEMKTTKKQTHGIKNIENLRNEIADKIKIANKKLEILEHSEEIKELEDKEHVLKHSLEELEREEFYKKEVEKDRRQRVYYELTDEGECVFRKKDLTNEQVEILLENAFIHINEYCAYEKKVITVLIDTISNHSTTHTFLVWSVQRLLKSIRGISHIRQYNSVEADITFRYHRKTYALEIEKGSLARKKEQMNEKVEFLDRKYKDRWMFIVSHRDLVKKYKRFGLTSARNDVMKKIKKLLEIK